MTAPDTVPLHTLAEDNLAATSPDLLHAMLKTLVDAITSAETDALCNAEYGQDSDERVNHRNGYRPREWDTGAGVYDLTADTGWANVSTYHDTSVFADTSIRRWWRSEAAWIISRPPAC